MHAFNCQIYFGFTFKEKSLHFAVFVKNDRLILWVKTVYVKCDFCCFSEVYHNLFFETFFAVVKIPMA